LLEDVEEGIAGGVIDCAFDIDDDEQVADQENEGEDAAEDVRADHGRGDGTTSILIVKSAKIIFPKHIVASKHTLISSLMCAAASEQIQA
jgi:hypothetical protein